MQDLEPPAIGTLIGVIGNRDPVRKVDVHPLHDADRDAIFQHRDRELAYLGRMFPGRQINPEKIDIV